MIAMLSVQVLKGGSGFQPLDEAAAGSRSHLGRALLETLTYNYLGDWIRRQQDGVKRGEDGAADRLVAAKGLQEKLKLILKGEPPCDIFVRWKPIEEQPMGWDPDMSDFHLPIEKKRKAKMLEEGKE